MTYVNESLAKGLANRVIRSTYQSITNREPLILSGSQRRICKSIHRYCNKYANAVIIDERYRNSNKWQLVWGEWTLISNKGIPFFKKVDIKGYDKIGFDLTINTRNSTVFKVFYVVLSKHALQRLIMRAEQPIKNSHDISEFLNRLTKKLLFASLELGIQSEMSDSKNEGYVNFEGKFLPLSYRSGINHLGQKVGYCTIKTVMPEHFDGAKSWIDKNNPLAHKDSFFEYESMFYF